MTAMKLHRYPSPSNGVALGKMGCTDLFHRITAKDYVQSGLVAMWDGIENAGWGIHDASATTWKDLIGNLDAILPNNASFGVDCLVSTGTTGAAGSINKLLENCTGITCEAVFNIDEDGTIRFVDNSAGTGTNNTASGFNHYVYIFNQQLSSRLAFGHGTWSYTAPAPSSILASRTTVSVVTTVDFISGETRTYHNGTLVVSASNMKNLTINYFAETTLKLMVGKGRMFRGGIYSRALTADEIARNYAIDKARFKLP